jgi:hypothetical protein
MTPILPDELYLWPGNEYNKHMRFPQFQKLPVVIFALAGTLSGVTLLLVPGAFWVGPGVLFGAATGWAMKNYQRLNLIRVLLWIALSSGAWYGVIRFYLSNLNTGSQTSVNSDLKVMILCGLIGAAILAVAHSIVRLRFSPIQTVVIILLGAALAAVMEGVLVVGSDEGTAFGSIDSYVRLGIAFAVWQTGVGLAVLGMSAQPKNH